MTKYILRAWLPTQKKMLHHDEISLTEGHVYERIYDSRSGYMNSFKREDGILMLYIGLKDSESRPVYEGDVIKFYFVESTEDTAETTPIVWFGDSEWSYPAFDLDGRFIKDHHFEGNAISELASGFYHFEVIGNIYENPELINTR